MFIGLVTFGLWIWVLTETLIFLAIVQNVQGQIGELNSDLSHLRDAGRSDAKSVHFLNLELSLSVNPDGDVMYWKPNHTGLHPKPSFLKEEVDFVMSSDGSRVRVLKSGLYQVYAQLDWDLSARETGRLQLRVGRHNTNSANSTVLATCTVTGKAERADGVDEGTCYTSAVSQLKTNQQVWVSTPSPKAQINGAPDKSFFGLVKL